MNASIWRGAATLAATIALAMGAAAAHAGPGDKPKKQKPQQVVPTGAEDAAAPTAAEEAVGASLERMLDRSTEGLEVLQLGNGTEAVDLEGRFMHVSLAVKDAEGRTHAACVGSAAELRRLSEALRRAKPAPVVLEEK